MCFTRLNYWMCALDVTAAKVSHDNEKFGRTDKSNTRTGKLLFVAVRCWPLSCLERTNRGERLIVRQSFVINFSTVIVKIAKIFCLIYYTFRTQKVVRSLSDILYSCINKIFYLINNIRNRSLVFQIFVIYVTFYLFSYILVT